MGLFDRTRKPETRELAPAELRAPRAATQSLRYLAPGQATPPDWNAHQAFEMAYYMSVVAYSCIRLLANVVSSLPFRAGIDPAKPNEWNPQARLAQLLGPPPGGPTPNLSARRLWAWTTAQRRVSGRCGWEIETDAAGRVVALWPLASSYLTPVKSLSGPDWFSSFTYGRPGYEKTLAPDGLVYDWDPSGTDFREPESPLRAAHLDIAISVMQSTYDYSFLRNDARPAAIVVTEEFEDETAFEAFKRQWNTSYGGPDQAGKAAFLEARGAGDSGVKGAVDVTVLGISPKDAQAAERHTAAMQRVAIALGTPWSLLDASGRTFDNASQEWRTYVTTTVLPFVRDLQDMVNIQLAPRLGAEVGWFDLATLQLDEWERIDPTGAATLYEAGIITKNEARKPFNLAAVTDGDQFLDPAPASATALAPPARAEVEAEQREPVLPATVPAPVPALGSPTVVELLDSISANVDQAEDRGPTPEEIEARRARVWRTTDSRVRNLERQWARAMRRLFARQARAAIARLEGKRGRQHVRNLDVRATADEVFDPQHWLTETFDDVLALYEAVTAAGGARVSDLFGLAFDLEAPWVQDFIRARANQLAGQVTSTTYEAIQSAMADGVAAGESIPQLAERIRHVFDVASNSRATTIARTEVISAFNGSAMATASSYGPDVVAGQEWIATRDARTRESHAELDGAVIGMGELFDNGLAYPGDPSGDPGETVNCRCTVAFLTPDDMATSTGRSRMVERRVARAVLELVRPGMDTDTIRRAVRAAA